MSNDWKDVVNAERGQVFLDRHDEGLRFRILRGGASLCAYVGVPDSHPLAGFDYDSIPVRAHGGLTYDGGGDDKYHPKGWYWYGWDYAHCGDRCVYDDKYPELESDREEIRWTPEMVEKDAQETLYDFRALAKLAERIAVKTNPEVRHV